MYNLKKKCLLYCISNSFFKKKVKNFPAFMQECKDVSRELFYPLVLFWQFLLSLLIKIALVRLSMLQLHVYATVCPYLLATLVLSTALSFGVSWPSSPSVSVGNTAYLIPLKSSTGCSTQSVRRKHEDALQLFFPTLYWC